MANIQKCGTERPMTMKGYNNVLAFKRSPNEVCRDSN